MPRSSKIPKPDAKLLADLVVGNRILFDQGVVDAFGHLSVRHDKDPAKYLMSCNRAPGLIEPHDILTYDLDSVALDGGGRSEYAERFIHGEIYRLRPDAIAVVHCHAPSLIPFGATRTPLRPIYHMGAFLGAGAPIFEIREAGGMTDMLVRDAKLGKALAVSLGDKPIILMRGHGATLVGSSIRQVVYRSVYAAQNAMLQMEAMRLGEPVYLAPEEAAKATSMNDSVLERPWSLWQQKATGAS